MKVYTQTNIDDLIACPKKISDPPRRDMKLVGGFLRNDMKLLSDGIEGEFSVFLRQSEDFPENFSIGLVYDPKDGSGGINLLRCNGQHGIFGGTFDPDHTHWDYHIHKASEAAIAAGLKPEKYAEKTLQYASLEQAVQYFMKAIKLDEAEAKKYFPDRLQGFLPFEEEV